MSNTRLNLVTTPYAEDENSHNTMHNIGTGKSIKNFDENYQYIKKGFLFNFFSILVSLIAMVVLIPVGFFTYGLRVKGRKNFKKVKGGSVICCNHNILLDCALVGPIITRLKAPYYLSSPIAFNIPIVKHMVRLLRAVPVPANLRAMGVMQNQIVDALKNGKSIVIFPEGSNWAYYYKLRNFKKGAFTLAVKAQVPVVPITFSYRSPNWFYRMFGRKKPLVTIVVHPAITSANKTAEQLKQETYFAINSYFPQNYLDS